MTIAAPQSFPWTREMCARNAMPEYWTVNLAEAAPEVHRDPREEPAKRAVS